MKLNEDENKEKADGPDWNYHRTHCVDNPVSHTMKPLTSDIIDFVKNVKTGSIYFTRPNGHAGPVVKGTLTVFDDRHLIFAEIPSSGNVAEFRNNQRIVVEAIDFTTRKGYRFNGFAQNYSASNERNSLPKFSESGSKAKGHVNSFLLIEIESFESVLSTDFSRGAAERNPRKRWKMLYNNLWKF